ncbi:zinc finger protein-like [Tropilaelaps mercedesae]|uniref:Zinc finger protein-like n=1 Tax=Tropilaelaps mercedesae TaxID=418985 RepID=A0A1V9XC92_9ACAR|nr:zinc finger protein-like [Tropilaelaps mercedesae]
MRPATVPNGRGGVDEVNELTGLISVIGRIVHNAASGQNVKMEDAEEVMAPSEMAAIAVATASALRPRSARPSSCQAPTPANQMNLFCSSCSFVFDSVSALRCHEKLHHGDGSRPFACHLCDYRAKVRSHLTSHLRTHTVDRPFACPHCDFTAKRANHLKMHLEVKHGTAVAEF